MYDYARENVKDMEKAEEIESHKVCFCPNRDICMGTIIWADQIAIALAVAV
ncbi:hypothetical protein CC2G_002102 [Coprinopsis cinerea AmutBmut pab1-1]|nr:hypothetical protein CC2G_002102 [Coprinopsis cinerea AmutBmut pab1-1]